MDDATFCPPDLTAFCRLDELGLVVVGMRSSAVGVVLECRVVARADDRFCRRCGAEAVARDTVLRRLAHVPFGWRPTILLVRVRRYRCSSCRHVWRQDTTAAADDRAKLSRGALAWALVALVVAHLSVARVAEALGVAWDTANDAVLAEGHRVLIADPSRFDAVAVIGVDEHVWRHTRRGDKYVTVVIDLNPVRDGVGPAWLLDMVEGRSKQVFKTWLAARPAAWQAGIEVVAMDGFTGFKTAAAEELPHAVAVMDPFHVVQLAGDALDRCRRRVQQELHRHRGLAGDPLYRARRTLHTGAELLTDRQVARLEALFTGDEHVQVEATWGIYQRMIPAYRHPDPTVGRELMTALIDSVSHGVPGRAERGHHPRSDAEEAGERRPGVLRQTPHQQRPHGGDQRAPGAPARLRARLPQPDELHSLCGIPHKLWYVVRVVMLTGPVNSCACQGCRVEPVNITIGGETGVRLICPGDRWDRLAQVKEDQDADSSRASPC